MTRSPRRSVASGPPSPAGRRRLPPGRTRATSVARVAKLEAENAALLDELERLRDKRDKDVAALDELIAQLKPLIEEV